MIRPDKLFTIDPQRTVANHESHYVLLCFRGFRHGADKVERTLRAGKLAHKEKDNAVARQAPLLAQLQSTQLQPPALAFHQVNVNHVRYKKYTLWARPVMLEIFVRPRTRRKAGVETWNKLPVRQQLRQPDRATAIKVQMRVSTNKHLHPRSPCSPDCLPGTLVIPTIHQDSIVGALPNNFADFRSIKSAKA